MREVGVPRHGYKPSGRLVRFAALTFLLQAALLFGSEHWMVRAIRADGGTRTELLFYAFYAVVLLLGIASALFLVGAGARWLFGPRGELIAALIFAAIIGLSLLIDVTTFVVLGLHPYGAVTWAAVGTADVKQLPRGVFAAAAGLIALAFLMSAALWHLAGRHWPSVRWTRIEPRLPRRAFLYFLLAAITFVALDHPDDERVIPRAALPFYGLWIGPANRYPDARPAYPISSAAAPVTFARRPDIVVLLAESLRWDVMTGQVMPHLAQMAARPNCAAAQQHYAGGHLTQYGTFSLLYGMASYAFLPFMKEGRRSDPLAALRANGYSLEAFDATGLLSYTIAPLVPSQFDAYHTMLGRDSSVADGMIAALSKPSDKPRFVFGFFYSTHGPYFHPKMYDRFPTTGGSGNTRDELFNRYRNSAGYLDVLMGRLDSVLAPRIADGSAVLMFGGDHGEEFWEFGLLGHAAVAFHDVRTRVPMLLCFPEARAARMTLSTHADVLPTLFDWMGAAGWDSTRITGRSLLSAEPRAFAALSGAGYPTQANVFALVTKTHKFWLHANGTDLGAVSLDRATDTHDIPVDVTPAVRADLDHALASYLRSQRTVLRVN